MEKGRRMKKIYDYWLCSIPGIGNYTIARLFELFGGAKGVYNASEEALRSVLKKNQLEELEKLRECWELQKEYDRLGEKGITFLTKEDRNYPMRLKNIPDAPHGIFFRGMLPKEDCLSVAIIGARDCSEYGRYIAKELGSFLGKSGVQVISGMARGIDGISQEAALQAGGTTTAVLGSGVDVCYPKQNRALYENILKQGCILSAYPPGTLPKAQNFPPRNRIVSGLSDVVVVVEARNKSGTLITVDMALEQGKEVYVVPGRITDRLSDGCNRLLKQGAGLLLSPTEFLEEIQGGMPQHMGKKQTTEVASEVTGLKKNVQDLPKELHKIYDLLELSPKSTEQILGELTEDMGISELNVRLMKLCVMGLAVQESPGYFVVVF